jgi:hypothetical protein
MQARSVPWHVDRESPRQNGFVPSPGLIAALILAARVAAFPLGNASDPYSIRLNLT